MCKCCLALYPCFSVYNHCEGERARGFFTTTEAYLFFLIGRAGHDPVSQGSTFCVFSGIRWTGLNLPTHLPAACPWNISSVQLQSANFSINFIWIDLWGSNDFTLRLDRKKNTTLLFLKECSPGFMLSFYVKTSFALLHCHSTLNTPFLSVIERSLKLESVPFVSISYWDHLTRPCKMLLSDPFGDEGLKMEITLLAFQE